MPYDSDKIAVAMTKAFLAVEGGTAAASPRIRDLVRRLTEQVTTTFERRFPSGGTLHIEDVQDQVELALMRSGEHKVARDYVLPMAAAIWSTPAGEVGTFPAEPFLRFFDNHGLLSLRDRPAWRTVEGGSRTYVEAFRRSFRGRILTSAPVRAIRRGPVGVRVRTADGAETGYDRVKSTHFQLAQAYAALKDTEKQNYHMAVVARLTGEETERGLKEGEPHKKDGGDKPAPPPKD